MNYHRVLPKVVSSNRSQRIYAFGGASSNNENKLVEVYNKKYDKWRPMNIELPQPFSNIFSFAVLLPALTTGSAIFQKYDNDINSSTSDDKIIIINFGAVSRSAPKMYLLNTNTSRIMEIDYDSDNSEF